ncbi:MAG: cation transporter [Planctomycetes bacterium]|nr:cation transporter [Planctomycetota bacterium]
MTDAAREQAARQGMRLTLYGIFGSAVLATIKIISGVVGNSYALIADGVESLTDILSSFVVWGSLRIAAIPPDENHPFGHGRAESLGALAVALALLAAAVTIALQSVREIVVPHHAPAPFTLVVLVLVVVFKELLYRRFRATGEKIGSRAVQSDAWHHRSDALTSAAAFVGISIALIAGKGYESADDWAALVACGVIGWNGVRLLRAALDDVMDAAPPPEDEQRIRRVASEVEGVHAIEKCRIRRTGLTQYVEIHVEVNGDLTVRAGHEIGHRVKDALLASDVRIQDVTVHIEPAGHGAA